MPNELFWLIVKNFNELMNSAIEGPNCIDPKICKGDCCSIKIDIPKVLAKEYIKRSFARKEDFIRSNVFSFQLRFNESTGKCFLFDKSINGCKVHNSGIKPPQCWIYPTNFSNPENKEISCKKVSGWRIIDLEKTKQAEILLKKHVFLCELEAKKELKKIELRVGKEKSRKSEKKIANLKNALKKIAPSQLGGFQDTWNCFIILSAEGFSLQMKKFCSQNNTSCKYLKSNFLECPSICDKIADDITRFLQNHIYEYVKQEGLDTDGKYPLYRLFEFVNNKKNLIK